MPTNCLSVFDHFVGLALKGLKKYFFSDQRIFWFQKLTNSSRISNPGSRKKILDPLSVVLDCTIM